ncbi:MAG: shikimate kinase [Pricia sp.]
MENSKYIVILVGVCGTGKSAVGQKVANKLNIPFFDVDQMPTSEALQEGKLLQDENNEKWLASVKELIIAQSAQKGCVISCSILKKEHREMLTTEIDHPLDWVFMRGSYEFVAERVKRDGGVDRSASALKADFEMLEIPKRALTIDMTGSEQEIVDTILKYLARKYG